MISSLTLLKPLGIVMGQIHLSIAIASCPLAEMQPQQNDIPIPAKMAGYSQKTFESRLPKSSIDMADSRRSGFQWYVGHFFSKCSTNPESLTWDRDQLVLTGANSSCNPIGNVSLASAVHRSATKDWAGVAFGGGAYIEATLSFDPEQTIKAPKGTQWPAFWAMSIEHLAQLPTEKWGGENDEYMHFSEVDVFEYDVWEFAGKSSYGGAVHDWFGKYKETCPQSHYCRVTNAAGGGSRFENFVITTPSGTNFKQPHRYGVLWRPATQDGLGTLEYYFDRKLTTSKVHWRPYRDQSPPPGMADWTFGILDKQHLVLILSTGIGQPLYIRNVVVWQKDECQNLYGQSTIELPTHLRRGQRNASYR